MGCVRVILLLLQLLLLLLLLLRLLVVVVVVLVAAAAVVVVVMVVVLVVVGVNGRPEAPWRLAPPYTRPEVAQFEKRNRIHEEEKLRAVFLIIQKVKMVLAMIQFLFLIKVIKHLVK